MQALRECRVTPFEIGDKRLPGKLSLSRVEPLSLEACAPWPGIFGTGQERRANERGVRERIRR